MTIIQKTENEPLTGGERRAVNRFLELEETHQLFDGNITLYRVYRKNGVINIRWTLHEDWHASQTLKREAGTDFARFI